MDITAQVERLVELGVPELADVPAAEVRALASGLPDAGVLVVGRSLVTPSKLASLLRHRDKPGFVVEDMTDLDEFTEQVEVPDAGLYVVTDLDRGDDLRNWTPNDAGLEIASRGRTPLTISEGISWLLQEPEQLRRDHCFMCIGSRKPKAKGLDSRTPAIWISNGTGRDGAVHTDAPKVGWCWAGNRHTWLGFASAQERKA